MTIIRRARWHASLMLALLCTLALQTHGAAAQGDFVPRARQAYLMDADSGGVLFHVAGEEQMYPASMSKLMTLAVLFKTLKEGARVRPAPRQGSNA